MKSVIYSGFIKKLNFFLKINKQNISLDFVNSAKNYYVLLYQNNHNIMIYQKRHDELSQLQAKANVISDNMSHRKSCIILNTFNPTS